jgi:hypothetical protein
MDALDIFQRGHSFTGVVSNSGGQVTSSAAVLTANANPEGLYIGTLTNSVAGTTMPVFAIVLKDRTFAIFASASPFGPHVLLGITITGGRVAPAVGAFTTPYTATTQPGFTLDGTQNKVSGTITGPVVAGTSITGTYVSPLDSGSLTVIAVPGYGRAGSLAAIAGTYQYGYAGGPTQIIFATTTVNVDGTATVTDNAFCSGPAVYSVPDTAHNACKVTNSAQCSGQPTMPALVGLGAFFPAGTGAALNGGTNFATDTFVAIADNGINGFMIVGSK